MLAKEFTSYGLKCLVVRNPDNPFSKINGYVGIWESQPWYGKKTQFLEELVPVHGGVTYASKVNPATHEKDGRWWIGFDTGHLGVDIEVELNEATREGKIVQTHEWTVDEVAEEAKQLALQIASNS